MFSHAEIFKRIQGGFSPKINTFKNQREEVTGHDSLPYVGYSAVPKI